MKGEQVIDFHIADDIAHENENNKKAQSTCQHISGFVQTKNENIPFLPDAIEHSM